MNWQLLWFVLAGLVLGFAFSTLWEWFYFRRERMIVRDERISELEEQLRACEQREREQLMAAPPWTAPGYQSPSALLESEQAEALAVSVGVDDLVESSELLEPHQYQDDEADTIERRVDEGTVPAGAILAAGVVASEGGRADEAMSDEELPDESAAEDVPSETPPADEEEDSPNSGKILAGAVLGAAGLAAVAAATGGSDDEFEEDASALPVDVSVAAAEDALSPEDVSGDGDLPEGNPDEDLPGDPVTIDAAEDVPSETPPVDEEEDSPNSGKILAGAVLGAAGLAAVAAATDGSDDESEEDAADEPVDDSVAAAEEESEVALPSEGEPDEGLLDESVAIDAAEDAPSETPADDEEDDTQSPGKILAGAALGAAGLAAIAAATGGPDDESEEEAADKSVDVHVAAAEEKSDDALPPEGEPDEDLPDEPVAIDAEEVTPFETPTEDEEDDTLSTGKMLAGVALGAAGLAAVAAATDGSDDEFEEEAAAEPVGVSVAAAVEESGEVLLSQDASEGEDVPESESERSTDEPRRWNPEDIHGHPDNLLRVKGVGKVYCRRLYDAGIFTWHQLGQMNVDEITEIAHPFVSADVEQWPQRARTLAERNGRADAEYVGPAPDDLTEIRGIGANTMQRLYKGGIWSFSQLATSSQEDLQEIIPTSPSGENINYEQWIELAIELAQELD